MADISSLINPPEEEIAPLVVPKTEIIKTEIVKTEPPKTELASPETLKEETEDSKVSQETILEAFTKIKTHFPAARIKKIMQSDEDIGKVAQATPVVVGRALEIFMANLVEAAIIEAKKAGVRRIAASHIRQAVENTEQFDFVVDVVSKYLPKN